MGKEKKGNKSISRMDLKVKSEVKTKLSNFEKNILILTFALSFVLGIVQIDSYNRDIKQDNEMIRLDNETVRLNTELLKIQENESQFNKVSESIKGLQEFVISQNATCKDSNLTFLNNYYLDQARISLYQQGDIPKSRGYLDLINQTTCSPISFEISASVKSKFSKLELILAFLLICLTFLIVIKMIKVSKSRLKLPSRTTPVSNI